MNEGGNNDSQPLTTLKNTSSPDKIFGSNMPDVKIEQSPISQQIYGSDNYYNKNLQGYDHFGSGNIIDIKQMQHQINQVTQDDLERYRRQQFPNNQLIQYDQFGQPIQPNYNSTYNQSNISDSQQHIDLATADGRINYLNSISPATVPKKKKKINTSLHWFIIGAISLVVIIMTVVIVSALGNVGKGFSAKATVLGKSIANLSLILDYGASNEKYNSPELSSITAEAILLISSHQYQLSQKFPFVVDKKGNTAKVQADKKTTEKLEKAKTVGNLSPIYRGELENRLMVIESNLKSLYKATNKKAIRSELQSAYNDIDILLDRINKTKSPKSGELTDIKTPDKVVVENELKAN